MIVNCRSLLISTTFTGRFEEIAPQGADSTSRLRTAVVAAKKLAQGGDEVDGRVLRHPSDHDFNEGIGRFKAEAVRF